MTTLVDSYRFAASGGAFDPLSIPWEHAFWASDPGWSDPGDGNPVTSWRDAGSAGNNATQLSSYAPTFDDSFAGLNNQPVVHFTGIGNLDITRSGSLAQPLHVYVVGVQSSGALVQKIMAGGITAAVQYYGFLQLSLGAEGHVGTEIATDTAFQFCGFADGSSSVIRANGQSHTVDAGTNGTGTSFAIASASWIGRLVFVGIHDGAIPSGDLDDLDDWAVATYGVAAL